MGRVRPPADPTPAPPVPTPAPDPAPPAPAPKPAPPVPKTELRVTANTPTGRIGDVSAAAFALVAKGTPLAAAAAECVRAARGCSAMALAYAQKESSLGTGASARATRNPLGLMRRPGDARRCLPLPGGCLLRFGSWADAFAEFARRQAAPPYDPAKPLRHNVLVYVGGPRCPDILAADPDGVCANGHRWESGDPETDLKTYVDQTVERINAGRALDGRVPAPSPTPTPSPKPVGPVFGRVPRPAIVEQIVEKPMGAGWYDYGPRDELLAIVLHNVLGNASTTGAYFSTFVPPDGGHGWGALTDWGVCNANDGPAWDGTILKWNDPDGRRSPYASGGYGTPSGDGPAYIALCKRLGRNINQASEAIEISRRSNGAAVSDPCLRSIVALVAYRVDRKAKVPWNVWPKNRHGVQMILTHKEMGKPECDAIDVVSDVVDGVRDLLREYQGQGAPVPAPPIAPPVPVPARWLDEIALPDGVDEAFLRRRFGRLVSAGKAFAFDPTGIVSEAWTEQAIATGRYPEIEAVELGGGTARFVFAGGLVVDARAGKARLLRGVT